MYPVYSASMSIVVSRLLFTRYDLPCAWNTVLCHVKGMDEGEGRGLQRGIILLSQVGRKGGKWG